MFTFYSSLSIEIAIVSTKCFKNSCIRVVTRDWDPGTLDLVRDLDHHQNLIDCFSSHAHPPKINENPFIIL